MNENNEKEEALQFLVKRAAKGQLLNINDIFTVETGGSIHIEVNCNTGMNISWKGLQAEWQDALAEYFSKQIVKDIQDKYTRT